MWIYRACVFLVTSCPCALVLSTPATVVSGLSAAANRGVLIKGGQFLENLSLLKALCFDKTGTLTMGDYKMVNVAMAPGMKQETLMYWLSSAESQSSHPISNAVRVAQEALKVQVSDNVEEYRTLPGEGISARVDDETIFVGNFKLAAKRGWIEQFPAYEDQARQWEQKGFTVGWVGSISMFFGLFAVADSVRPGVESALQDLRQMGAECSMLTGDNAGSARKVASVLQFPASLVHSQLTPADKLDQIYQVKPILERKKRFYHLRRGTVGMVGDGINDAPALAACDVGIAMGVAGTPVAIETSDVIIFSSNMGKLAEAVRLAKSCRVKVLQNVVFSIVLKITILALTLTDHVGLIGAILSDVLGAMFVITNGMLVMFDKKVMKRKLELLYQRLTGAGNTCHQEIPLDQLPVVASTQVTVSSAPRSSIGQTPEITAIVAAPEKPCCDSGKCSKTRAAAAPAVQPIAPPAAPAPEKPCCDSGKCSKTRAAPGASRI